jgi:glycosyltransferase involved in cell wall biosynthesis
VLPRIAYISFDVVPAPKGASTHIEAFARALARQFGSIDLITIADGPDLRDAVERWPGVQHWQLPAVGASLIDRVLCFRRWLEWRVAAGHYDAVQFRSIFEGTPLLRLDRRPRLVFEVNGLPSIELKYRYPGAADDRELMSKIRTQEDACLRVADRVVTPSGVTADYLSRLRGTDSSKIRVIPNGVDVELFRPGSEARERKLIYFGTLSRWQGVETAIRTLHQVRVHADFQMTIVGPGDAVQRESLAALAAKLGVAEHVEFAGAVGQWELAERVRRSFAVLAPLPVNDRNVLQGCCPLKVLEGMASGVPVIASDLPVVREIGLNEEHLLLVKAGSVDEMAAAVLRLAGDQELWARVGGAARRRIVEKFTWERAGESLGAVYETL